MFVIPMCALENNCIFLIHIKFMSMFKDGEVSSSILLGEPMKYVCIMG